ncbi:3-deoxy-D-manno-octulosonic-acid transferase [Paramagnetospirillum magnetotacticum MS-1]|uniref:3-deoxy-D-manno-octulosonic acid transferase n=1 Tax=Paramagnetospirillum magnetotacticum MS-1 TaxID=272627 RepID=A0A0C2YR07_PARME|nr:3-deoxy-D-manno-octulosonic acid transferase [Paramagnetospirillum magnetotacticum]KIL97568.1 3-deoxy-D-manno-octulosonic-acid transferase [Paramagnetospirillum magnetotacticum MS-1]
MIYRLYRGLTTMGGPLISAYLERRKERGKEDGVRFPERLGHPGSARPMGPLVWMHGASVGEALSMLPLVERLIARGLSVLMTTGTVTSARLLAERLPKGAVHQYVPVDRIAYVRAFLNHWRPDLALWAESEFWPNLLAETRHRGIPQVLIQGRMSAKSFAAWKKVPGFIHKMLSGFALCLAQTESDAGRLRALGAREVRCLGNLKYAVAPLPCDQAALERVKDQIAGRPLWLAASTHPGEEALAGRVHAVLGLSGLLTIIAPRHHTRGKEVADELRAQGLTVSLRSAGEAITPETAVYVADTMGELGLFYRLGGPVFVGKSLCVGGGQNPFEPALLGAAVLFGPLMDNFPDMAPSMLAAGAALRVRDEGELAVTLRALLADVQGLQAAGAAAKAWADGEAGVLDQVEDALAPYLAPLEAGHARS